MSFKSNWWQLYDEKVVRLSEQRIKLFSSYHVVKDFLNQYKWDRWSMVRKMKLDGLSNQEIDLFVMMVSHNLIRGKPNILALYGNDVKGGLQSRCCDINLTSRTVNNVPREPEKFRELLKNLPKNGENLFDVVVSTLFSYNPRELEDGAVNMREYMFNIMATFSRLKRGGSAIIRLSIPNTNTLMSMIVGLNQRFQKVDLVRMEFGSPVSMKMYAICQDYHKPCPESTFNEYISRVSDIDRGQIYDDNTIDQHLSNEQKHRILEMITTLTLAISNITRKQRIPHDECYASQILAN